MWLDNLFIYYQEGICCCIIVDNVKCDCIENYELSNDVYVVEELGCVVMVENVYVMGVVFKVGEK